MGIEGFLQDSEEEQGDEEEDEPKEAPDEASADISKLRNAGSKKHPHIGELIPQDLGRMHFAPCM